MKIVSQFHVNAEQPIKDLERHHYSFVRMIHPDVGEQIFASEFDFIRWLERAESLVAMVGGPHVSVHQAEPNKRGGTKRSLTALGKKIYGLCRTYEPDVVKHYSNHRFSPPLALALKVVGGRAFELVSFKRLDGTLDLHDPEARRVLDEIAYDLRQTRGSAAYRSEVERYRRNQNKNLASCAAYLAAQFERRSVLLVTRIDLYIRPAFRRWGYTLEADACYTRLLSELAENRLIPGVMGYIAKREDGIDRGIHFHLLVVQDGHAHRDASNMARVVGERWVEICGTSVRAAAGDDGVESVEQRGSYFNCYSRKDYYLFNGIGLVRPFDKNKLQGLRLAIEYFCKESYQLKPVLLFGEDDASATVGRSGKGIRNLRRGVMPKGHSGRGAPRRVALDDSFIKSILLKQ